MYKFAMVKCSFMFVWILADQLQLRVLCVDVFFMSKRVNLCE